MIVPCIDLQAGQAVQLIGGQQKAIDGGDPFAWLARFAPIGEIAVVDLDAAMGRGDNEALVRALIARAPCRVGGGIRDAARARAWLDAGASKVVLGTAARQDVLRDLPKDRVVAALDVREGEVMTHGWQTATGQRLEDRIQALLPHVGGFLVTVIEREGRMQGCDLALAQRLRTLCGDLPTTFAGGITTAAEIAALDALHIDAQVGMAIYSGRLDLAEAFCAPLKSDRPDGLWPTIVCDDRGTALGLAYSDLTSLRAALTRRQGIYHSRTRGLWVKGESSGATQELLHIDVDCDRDALRFTVRQRPPGFCHNDTWTCFGPARGLGALEHTLHSRKLTAPQGSYAARLFDDPALLAAKLREEAHELAEATSRADIIHEAADVLFFTATKLAAAGASLADIDRVLDARALPLTRRPGNAKRDHRPELPHEPVPEPVPVPAYSPAVRPSAPPLLKRLAPTTLHPRRLHIDPAISTTVATILAEVETHREPALRRYAELHDRLPPSSPLTLDRAALTRALDAIDQDLRATLTRTAARIRAFAVAQRACLLPLATDIPGGHAGHDLLPIHAAGCYAPGGRYPLPSSVLMTAITARVAGVRTVVVASPSPHPVTLAAAALAGADVFLCAGGAQALAAMAFGVAVPACDILCGPGNAYVTAAKQRLSGRVAVDLIAGPSELVILADHTAPPHLIAADLLAQAEHDPEAFPALVTTDESLIAKVEHELTAQLRDLPTADVARASLLAHGTAVVCPDLLTAYAACNALAPEHLQVMLADPDAARPHLHHAGALFLGSPSAEVFGDYGFGPNHVLPTSGAARSTAGLSVFRFLRARTWMRLTPSPDASDAIALAHAEGLAGHAQAARLRTT